MSLSVERAASLPGPDLMSPAIGHPPYHFLGQCMREAPGEVPGLQFEQREAVQGMLAAVTDGRGDLPGALIAQTALRAGCDHVLTFDKKAARDAGFRLLEIGSQ